MATYTPKDIASIITEDPNIIIENVEKLMELKTEKGPWGGGNEFDLSSTDKEFTDLGSRSYKQKEEPGKTIKPSTDPGEGTAGIKPIVTVKKPEGFTINQTPFKAKDEPGRSTANSDDVGPIASPAPNKKANVDVYEDKLLEAIDKACDSCNTTTLDQCPKCGRYNLGVPANEQCPDCETSLIGQPDLNVNLTQPQAQRFEPIHKEKVAGAVADQALQTLPTEHDLDALEGPTDIELGKIKQSEPRSYTDELMDRLRRRR